MARGGCFRPIGSIYQRGRPTASHYLKAVMDAILGSDNFRNELVWKRFNFRADVKRKFGALTDRLLIYGPLDTAEGQKVRRGMKAIRVGASRYTG